MKIAAVAVLAIVSATSCGAKKDPGEFIGIEVTPSKAYIVPGTGKSCYDRFHTTAENDPRSLSEFRLFFRNFRIQWRSTDNLTISIIRITIQSSALKDGVFETTLTESEIESLVASAGGIIKGVATSGAQKTINSSDTARAAVSDPALTGVTSVACGLAFGGIAFANKNPTPFSARVTIEVVGVAENPDSGEQSPVRQRASATAEYY